MRRPQLVLLVSLAAMAAGCAKLHARTEPEMPALTPPPPPPHVVEQYVDEPVPTIEPSPAETAMSAPPTRTAPPKPSVPRAVVEPPKPEAPRVEPERPASPPPSLTLKPPPGTETKTATSIRALLSRAANDLGRVNYSSLSTDGKAQYDTARRFMQQAEDALRGGNLVYAGKLADKAVTMAAVLVR